MKDWSWRFPVAVWESSGLGVQLQEFRAPPAVLSLFSGAKLGEVPVLKLEGRLESLSQHLSRQHRSQMYPRSQGSEEWGAEAVLASTGCFWPGWCPMDPEEPIVDSSTESGRCPLAAVWACSCHRPSAVRLL